MWRSKNITSSLQNITPHFTGETKIITLVLAILMLSFANIALSSSNIFNNSNVSALDYSSNIGIGFTFNPTLSVSLSSSDLVIPNLIPGSTLDSNSINVSVATNAAYGYTLSANVNDENLVHSNSNNDSNANTNNSIGNNLSSNVFSSIATNANLASLDDSEDTNIWGYSYKNNIASTPTWSSYSGLSNSISKVLFNTDSNAGGSIDFKIAAKASNTQPSGVYAGTINFYATTKPTPITLSEAYASEGKTMINGYYTMQDMTSAICEKTEAIGAQLQVLDIRDYKLYWISKLADNHCWMTQNLDLDLDNNRTYTHWDTDLGWEILNENAIWNPENSTISAIGTSIPEWIDSDTEPYSVNLESRYIYTSNSNQNDIVYVSISDCTKATNDDSGCSHSHIGNYYNWSAATAEANDDKNSICPKSWRMPTANNDKAQQEFEQLLKAYNILNNTNLNAYSEDGFKKIRTNPLYFIRSGQAYNGHIGYYGVLGKNGYYWANTVANNTDAYSLYFRNNYDNPTFGIDANQSTNTSKGLSVRCLAR